MPEFEHRWFPLQWHSGALGMGSGWDKKMTEVIEQQGKDGFELVTMTPQKDPTWFILFFKRQIG